jgi:hypothetical protein
MPSGRELGAEFFESSKGGYRIASLGASSDERSSSTQDAADPED